MENKYTSLIAPAVGDGFLGKSKQSNENRRGKRHAMAHTMLRKRGCQLLGIISQLDNHFSFLS